MENRILYGLMTLIFNAVGVPCFFQGKSRDGIIRLILYFCTFGVFACINGIMGIIQGIRILRMSDEEYVLQDKEALLTGFPTVKS